MNNILRLTTIALFVSLAAGCSSSGGSGGGSETSPPSFDGDLGYENVGPNFDSGYENIDPHYGVEAPESGPGPAFDLGYVYIPDIDEHVPVPSHPIEDDNYDRSSKMAAVKERSSEEETLYSVYIGQRRVGEIIVNDEGISVTAIHHDKTITATRNEGKDSWQIRGTDDNVKGDVKRLEDGTWLIREEITREIYVSIIQDGQRIIIPASDIKKAVKERIKPSSPKPNFHKLQAQKVRSKLG